MHRRQLIETLAVLPFGIFLIRCSSTGGANGGESPPSAPPMLSGTQAIYTSSIVSDHDHTFAIDMASFSSPPAAGVSGTTSETGGHTHSVLVSSADLQAIQTGESIQITTSSAAGHTHVFTFLKLAPA